MKVIKRDQEDHTCSQNDQPPFHIKKSLSRTWFSGQLNHINTSAHQHINTSTPEDINT
jgi:hypothetical protein